VIEGRAPQDESMESRFHEQHDPGRGEQADFEIAKPWRSSCRAKKCDRHREHHEVIVEHMGVASRLPSACAAALSSKAASLSMARQEWRRA
jgi:hypothetical protein